MVALVSDDDDGYDEDTMAALAMIAGLNSPDLSTDAPEYNGPEATYKIIVENQNHERIGTYCYRICKDDDGKWIAKKI